MREFLFWAFVLTALPGCAEILGIHEFSPPPDATTPDPGFNLVRGSFPRTGAVFCDIVKDRRCATPLDIERGIPLTEAAIALNTGRSSHIALDYSAQAFAECSGPKAIEFVGMFPEGEPVCLNCGEVLGLGKANPDSAAVCQAYCADLFLQPPDSTGSSLPVKPPTQSATDFCATAASVSTNISPSACIANACDSGGTLASFFNDPRRDSEPVVWFGVLAGVQTGGPDGNDLERTAPESNAFDVGAASAQWIAHGDAFVEFSAAGGSLIVGLSQVPSGCQIPLQCPDLDVTDDSIQFGIFVRYDGQFFVSEGGVLRNDGNPFGASMPGERFRVNVHDNGNGTASITYSKVVVPCVPGKDCNHKVFYASEIVANYRLRVDSSLFHQGATATNVRMMRIK